MKKKILIAFCCFMVIAVNAQFNLVNDGYFINTDITTTNGPDTIYPGMGYWYAYLLNDNQNQIYITPNSDRNNRNAAGLKVTPSNAANWTCGLAQRLSAPDKGIYRVGFWGKFSSVAEGQTNSYVRVFLRVDDTNSVSDVGKAGSLYFSRYNTNKVSTDQFLTNAWKYYTVDYDLSKKATKDNYTESFDATEDDIHDFSLYFSNFAAARGGDFQITGVTMTKVDNSATPSNWYNPGFEESYAIPYLLLSSTGTPVRAQESTTKGVWVLSLMDGISDPTKSQATVIVDSTQAYTDKRSMKLNVKYVKDFSKVCLATTLFNLPKDDYILSFYAKTDINETPFRIDVDNYNIEKASAKAGFPFSDASTIKENHVSSTDWMKYEVEFNNTDMSDTLSIAIRPHITPTGSSGDWANTEVTYWFDDFSIVKKSISGNNDIIGNKTLDVVVIENVVKVSNVNSMVEIIDLNGKVLDRKSPADNEVRFYIQNKGIYIVRSQGINNKVVVN